MQERSSLIIKAQQIKLLWEPPDYSESGKMEAQTHHYSFERWSAPQLCKEGLFLRGGSPLHVVYRTCCAYLHEHQPGLSLPCAHLLYRDIVDYVRAGSCDLASTLVDYRERAS